MRTLTRMLDSLNSLLYKVADAFDADVKRMDAEEAAKVEAFIAKHS